MTLADHKVRTRRPMSRECRNSRYACSSTRPMQRLVAQVTTALSRPTIWNCDGACLRPSGVTPTPRTLASFWPWAILVRHIPGKKARLRELIVAHTVCFLNALRSVAGQTGERAEAARNAKVHAQVHMGKPKDLPGFGIAVELKVEGIKDQDLINAAHQV